jgi:predicted component of type VI protein secretion system
MSNKVTQMVENLKSEVKKIQAELRVWSGKVKPQAEAKLKDLESRYHDTLKQLNLAQKELNAELRRTIIIVKKHQSKLAKTIVSTKKKTARKPFS